MIIPMKKYLFIGVKEELDLFLERAQAKALLEFIPSSKKKPLELSADISTLLLALKVLQREKGLEEPSSGEDKELSYLTIAEKVLKLKAERDKYKEEERLLELDMARVAIWGDFSMQDIAYIEKEGKRKVQFFWKKKDKKAPHSDEGKLARVDPLRGQGLFYLATEEDKEYYLAIHKETYTPSDMVEMRLDLSWGELRQQLDLVRKTALGLTEELHHLCSYVPYLQKVLLELFNEHALSCVKKEVVFSLEDHLFAIEAWAAASKETALFSLLEGIAVHAEEIAVEKEDLIPTYMENTEVAHMGEDLVRIYDIPAATDADPSSWVAWAFILFFAMIIADGGYGLLYLGLALILKWQFPKLKGQAKRLLNLFCLLGVSCVVWGVLTGSFFGVESAPQGVMDKFSVTSYLVEKKAAYHLHAQDEVYREWVREYPQLALSTSGQKMLLQACRVKDQHVSYPMRKDFTENLLLELSLVIGIIHLSLSFLRYYKRNPSGLGWILFMIGGYLYFPRLLHATSLVHFLGLLDKNTAASLGLYLLYGGMGSALACAFWKKKWRGLEEIPNLVQVFADTLSYLRLYALGLAGAVMAGTFNDMGAHVGLQIGSFLGPIIGGIVIFLGHSVNIALGTVGGVIHGLRLNFLEWYHYSFEGGGKLFKPLRLLKPVNELKTEQ